MNRDKVTSVRFNDGERTALTALAAKNGLSLSSWIRSVLLRQLRRASKKKQDASQEDGE